MSIIQDICNELNNKINHKKILVIAGNYQQFQLFCNERMMDYAQNNNRELDGIEYIYYSTGDAVRGCRLDDYIKFGTWYDRTDIQWDSVIYPSLKPDYWADLILKEKS